MMYRAVRTPLADAWRVLILSTYGAPDLMDKVFGGSLDQFLSKEMKAAMPKGPMNFSPGDWGSCQYDSASLVYNMWFEARKVLNFQEALYAFGSSRIKVNYRGIRDAVEEMIEELEGDAEDWEKDGEVEEGERVRGLITSVRVATTYDSLFRAAKDNAWDLWSAVYTLLDNSLEVTFEDIPKPGAMPSYVPILNALVQKKNFSVGVKCALAKEFGLIVDENSFVDFDT